MCYYFVDSIFPVFLDSVVSIGFLADKGWRKACHDDSALAKGLNIVEGKVVFKAVADVFGLPYEPLTI